MRTTRAAEWASVLFEMKRNEVKSVLCEMKICTLLKSVCEEASTHPLFSHNYHRDTRFLSLLLRRPRQEAYLTWYLENTDLENSDQRPEKLETSECFKDLKYRFSFRKVQISPRFVSFRKVQKPTRQHVKFSSCKASWYTMIVLGSCKI